MTSPFKFLDAFVAADKHIFFGRTAEVEQLYRLVFEANLVLVYGQSGTGKTSLIQCGLANRFTETDWFQLFVRRGDDINASLDREVRSRAVTPIPEGMATVDAIHSLYLDHLRPIYLIFDQFEELLILGTAEEQQAFFNCVAAILASDVSAKIIISLREEYLASLHGGEEIVPSLFDKRLRIEPMRTSHVEEVIIGMTGALKIKLENGKATARKIIEQLDDERVGVQLAYLQVYLDSLYDRAVAEGAAEGGTITFTDAAVAETGKLGDIMAGFLDEQRSAIEAEIPDLPQHAITDLLEQFVTVDGTKQPSSRDELLARMPDARPWIDKALEKLVSSRILRDVDKRFELAHDALAGHVNEARSGERKAMLMVQKLVRDRFTAFPQTRTYLSGEELAVVKRSRRHDEERTGVSLLDLTPDEEAYFKKSQSKNRWRRYRLVGVSLLIGAMGLITLIIMGASELEKHDRAIAATSDTDWLAYRSYTILKDPNDEAAAAVRQDMLNAEAELNTKHEWGLGLPGLQMDDFWHQLATADRDFDSGKLDEAKQAYALLAEEWGAKHAEDQLDLRARVRLKAILWRQYALADDAKGEGVAIMIRLHDLITPPDAYDPVNFTNDLSDACYELDRYRKTSPHCRSLRELQAQPG